MPVNAVPITSRMQLRLRLGFDGEGNPILRTRSYNNISPVASNDDLYDTGMDLAGLQDHDLEIIRRVNEFELEEE